MEKYLSYISLLWLRVVGVSEVEEIRAGGKARAKNSRRGAGDGSLKVLTFRV